jgi:hypothetical protein
MEWNQVASDFDQWDGSLRDIYVLGATEADWDSMLARLREFDPAPSFTVDKVIQKMPSQVADVFNMRATSQPMLTVMAGSAALHCHFFLGDDIEFDCDTRDITGLPQAEALANFMKLLGEITQKTVILCHENAQHLVIATYSPAEVEVIWENARNM